MVLDEALEGRIAEILRPLMRRWPDLDQEAVRGGQPQAGGRARRAPTILAPVGTAPGLVVPPAGDGRPAPTVVVLPGPAARAPGDVGGRGGHRAPFRAAVGAAAGLPLADHAAAVRDPGVRDRRDARGGRGGGLDLRRSRSPPACAGARSRSPRATQPRATPPTTPSRQRWPSATRTRSSPPTARRSTSRSPRSSPATRWPRRSPAPAGSWPARLTERAGLLGLRARRPRRLLQRGEGRARRGGPGADRAPRRRVPRGGRGAGRRRARAPRRRDRALHDRHRRARRRDRGEAGRHRLAGRQPRRRGAPDPPRAAPRRRGPTSATAPGSWPCTCSAGCCSASADG